MWASNDECGPCVPNAEHSIEAFLPGLSKRNETCETAVVHHVVLKSSIVTDLMDKTQEVHGKPLWLVFREACDTFPRKVSEYELYFAFAATFHSEEICECTRVFALVSDWRKAVQCIQSRDPECLCKFTFTASRSVGQRDYSGVYSALEHESVDYIVSHSHLQQVADQLPRRELERREGIVGRVGPPRSTLGPLIAQFM